MCIIYDVPNTANLQFFLEQPKIYTLFIPVFSKIIRDFNFLIFPDIAVYQQEENCKLFRKTQLLSNRMFLGSLCRLFFQGLENFLQALDFFLEAHEE